MKWNNNGAEIVLMIWGKGCIYRILVYFSSSHWLSVPKLWQIWNQICPKPKSVKMSVQSLELLYTFLGLSSRQKAHTQNISITLTILLSATTLRQSLLDVDSHFSKRQQQKAYLGAPWGIISINSYFQISITALMVQLHFIRVNIKALPILH